MTQPIELKDGQWVLVKMRIRDNAPDHPRLLSVRDSYGDEHIISHADIHSVLPDVIEVGDRVTVTGGIAATVVWTDCQSAVVEYGDWHRSLWHTSDLTLVSKGGA